MTADIQNNIGQLVEVNRALSQDLDLSRRIVAELSSERDVLRGHVERLESGFKARKSAKSRVSRSGGFNPPAGDVRMAHPELEEIRRERDEALRFAEDAGLRAECVEDQLRTLAFKVRQVEEERDDMRLQLDEMTDAMEEIRFRLSGLPATAAWDQGDRAEGVTGILD